MRDALVVLAAVAGPALAALTAGATADAAPVTSFIAATLAVDVPLLAAALWWRARRVPGRPMPRFGALSLDDVRRGLVLALVAFLAGLIAVAAGESIGVPPWGEGLVVGQPSPAFVLAVSVSRFVAGPVVEELFYRGALLPALSGRIGGPAAVVVQAMLFGGAHFRGLDPPDLIAMAATAAVGLVIGEGVRRWGRLYPAVLAHFVVNLG